MRSKIWYLPLLLLISVSYGKGFMNHNGTKMYVSTQAKEEARYKLNPHPQKHYRMTVTIKNAPGNFERLETFAYYRALNCQYILKGPAGAMAQPNKRIPLQFDKISETKYQGEFYVDGMLDEDYGYGKGVCQWSFGGVAVGFSATEDEEDTEFSASITHEDLNQKKLEISHFNKEYPLKEGKIRGFTKYGIKSTSFGIKKETFQPEEYFTFHIKLEEI